MSVDYPPPRVPHMVQFREPVDPGATFVDMRGSYDLRPPIDALRIRGYGGAQGNIACSGSSHSKSTLQALFSSPMHFDTMEAIVRAFMDLAELARGFPVLAPRARQGAARTRDE
jgi:hypothetical protein